MVANNELVYVLHTRNYRETSQLVDLFSRDTGRVRVVARGSRTKKRAAVTTLQPFLPFFASWRGRSDLKTLTNYEIASQAELLQGEALYVGFYMNELLCRLLPEYIPHPDLFEQYAGLITTLGQNADPEPGLRVFELSLLDDMGYGLNLYTDTPNGCALDPGSDYFFHPGEGFTKAEKRSGQSMQNIFSGAHLLAIADHQFSSKPVKQSAKRLMRKALALHLGQKPLYSRELFKQAVSVSGKPA